ncbi:hypothetical protein H072_10662 [Dactylellina haptotyla CBS 200.50]|uniref:Prokaryotic-type class I peptide chain release factors domain-containing protein n=1 Tax=Dactylellina haptotyla (strain CBS 200.50) TaxID=1284197 RepID=S7ZYT9_DACHA|nr:hypothetical protein H072_10662 [Dactylellina haptotyla CBS 200.50]
MRVSHMGSLIPRPITYPVCRQPRLLVTPVASRKRSFLTPENQDPAAAKELEEARLWLADFVKYRARLPRGIGTVTASRSSGPGGQNVNKSNSKATLRVHLEKLKPFVHPMFLNAIKQKGTNLANDGTEIVIQSEKTRSLRDNTNDCWAKMYRFITSAVILSKETSHEQRNRVQKLDAAFREKRLKEKDKQSSKKSDRRSKGDE